MDDPYHLLNVSRDAAPEVIKRAYRKLAKRLHPDRNPGDGEMEQRFMAITQAYQLLSDSKTRKAYDSGRLDGAGRPKRRAFRSTSARRQGAAVWGQGIGGMVDHMLAKFGRPGRERAWFNSDHGAGPSARNGSGAGNNRYDDAQPYDLDVDFVTAALGGKQRMIMADGRALDIDIPSGTEDQAVLRLKGQRLADRTGGEGGELLIRVIVRPHPLFKRRGHDLHMELPISLKEALFGARVRTPTLDGAVSLSIPAKANSGQIFRLRGKGGADRKGKRGDQYVRLIVMLPTEPSAEMAADLKRLAEHDNYPVRDLFDRH